MEPNTPTGQKPAFIQTSCPNCLCTDCRSQSSTDIIKSLVRMYLVVYKIMTQSIVNMLEHYQLFTVAAV